MPCHAPAATKEAAAACRDKNDKQRCGTTGLEEPPPGKGSRAPPRAAHTSVLLGAPGSRAPRSSLSLSYSYLSLGDAGAVGATLQGDSRAAGRDARWLLGAARRAGEAAQVTATHALGLRSGWLR